MRVTDSCFLLVEYDLQVHTDFPAGFSKINVQYSQSPTTKDFFVKKEKVTEPPPVSKFP
jgi:hypothetical protein